jgi:hypothetical protein
MPSPLRWLEEFADDPIIDNGAVQQDIDAEAARVNSNPTALIGDS